MAAAKKPVHKESSSKEDLVTTAATKLKKVTKSGPLKYADKSAGQPELTPIFDRIKELMKPFEKGSMKARGEKPGVYNLVSEKTFELDGRFREEGYFVTIMVQKGFVGFYYMPVYAEPGLKDLLHPDLVKCLKGKACFHIKKNDPWMMAHIQDALKIGYNRYIKRGWAE